MAAERAFLINGVRFEIQGEYGDNDGGGVYIYDHARDIEIVMWDMQEWKDEPSLVAVLMEAVDYANEGGVEYVAGRFKPDYIELHEELQRPHEKGD